MIYRKRSLRHVYVGMHKHIAKHNYIIVHYITYSRYYMV